MVRLVTQETLPILLEFCDKDDVFAAFIYTYGSVYCDVTSKVEVWLGYDNNNEPIFAAACSGNGYIIYPKDKTAYEFIWAFLSFMPKDNINCEGELMLYLRKKMCLRPQYSCIMKYSKGFSLSAKSIKQKPIHPKRFRDMYALLCNVFPKVCRKEKSDEWVYTTSLKERRGFVVPLCIYSENEQSAIACGMIDASNSKCCVLGGIAVAEAYRGMGLSRNIIAYLLSNALEKDMVAYVSCSREMQPFYQHFGFKVVGVYANIE